MPFKRWPVIRRDLIWGCVVASAAAVGWYLGRYHTRIDETATEAVAVPNVTAGSAIEGTTRPDGSEPSSAHRRPNPLAVSSAWREDATSGRSFPVALLELTDAARTIVSDTEFDEVCAGIESRIAREDDFGRVQFLLERASILETNERPDEAAHVRERASALLSEMAVVIAAKRIQNESSLAAHLAATGDADAARGRIRSLYPVYVEAGQLAVYLENATAIAALNNAFKTTARLSAETSDAEHHAFVEPAHFPEVISFGRSANQYVYPIRLYGYLRNIQTIDWLTAITKDSQLLESEQIALSTASEVLQARLNRELARLQAEAIATLRREYPENFESPKLE
jgi:hypothetical protein